MIIGEKKGVQASMVNFPNEQFVHLMQRSLCKIIVLTTITCVPCCHIDIVNFEALIKYHAEVWFTVTDPLLIFY